jgi:hypothetical protein
MKTKYHTCRKCNRVSYDPDWNMLRVGIRHWKHFQCLTLSELNSHPAHHRRYETWRLDYESDANKANHS